MSKKRSNNRPKIVTFFPNKEDNIHCLQSSVKSLLSFYFPDKIFTDELIEEKTLYSGGWSWLVPTVVWLNELGLEVSFFSRLNYEELSNRGEEYLRELKGDILYNHEHQNGAYLNFASIQESSKTMIELGLWNNQNLSVAELSSSLEASNTLAISKTVYEWMDGRQGLTGHFVLVLKQYKPGEWLVHDPGLPQKENRKVNQLINGENIFSEVLLIKGVII